MDKGNGRFDIGVWEEVFLTMASRHGSESTRYA